MSQQKYEWLSIV